MKLALSEPSRPHTSGRWCPAALHVAARDDWASCQSNVEGYRQLPHVDGGQAFIVICPAGRVGTFGGQIITLPLLEMV